MEPIVMNYLTLLFFLSLLHSVVFSKTPNKEMIDSLIEKLKEESREKQNGTRFVFINRSRISRNVNGTDDHNQNNITSTKVTKSKRILVKKPIPSFAEAENEGDYQFKLNNPVKFSDSVEREDEDFNIDDYDFDVHHDEFLAKSKLLQPRNRENISPQVEAECNKKDLRTQKVVVPRFIKPSTEKLPKEDKENKEYDDDSNETTEMFNQGRMVKDSDDYFSSESGKEYERQVSVRIARSSLSFSDYFEKFSEKTSALVSKVLTLLPTFPQMPVAKKLD